MKCGGVSLKGKHAINQDSFSALKVHGGYVVAVSDGLGSRPRSQAGSAALCQVACEVADEFSCDIDGEIFLRTIHERWLKTLTENNLSVDDCNATALIAVVDAKNIWAYRLGDGFICIAADDKAITLFDDKDGEFINATECLRAEFDFGKWERRQVTYKNFSGLVAATDGITFELNEKILSDFIKDFCANYSALELGEILADLKSWLPTLFGVDDKTLAFLLKEAIDIGD